MRNGPLLTVLAIALLGAVVPLTRRETGYRVGSKKFTESVVLGEMFAALGRDAGSPIVHARELGGTRVLFEALRSGSVDAYAEYLSLIHI